MAVLRALFDFYLKGSVHVAFAVCASQGSATVFLGMKFSPLLTLFTFLAAVSGYNFVKYAERARWYHKSLPRELKTIQIFSLICFLALIGCGLFLPFTTLAGFGLLSLLTMAYVVPMLPQAKTLRTLAGIKIFVVALVWAATAVGIPLWHEGVLPSADAYLLFVQFFLTVFALTIPFEIRDLQVDGLDLKTLPQAFGVQKSRYLGIAAVLLAAILEGFKDDFVWYSNIYWLLIALLTVLGLLRAKTEQPPYLAAFWIESIPIAGLIYLYFSVGLNG
ncbi:hypothetical protein [Gilvibacter sediminis]|uniref:hypothetical protein n=1 Tax=Gilvibacter sediminis TaxID=379071 RepID=UPI00235010BC|nr:hypothetical protein [Gilvibacter sediminis]MDC7997587.1 hypothetical protein [Gilvibacter sediminis]